MEPCRQIHKSLDRALNNPAPSPSHRLTATFAYYATYITLGGTMAISGPALPWLAQHTVSIIFVASSLGYMLGSLLSGRAFDRFPGHRILALALLMIALSAACVPLLQSLWFLVAVLILLGTFQGTLDVGCNTLLTWTHGEKVSPFMNGLHFFFGLGSFLAPLIFARVVLANNEIRWPGYGCCPARRSAGNQLKRASRAPSMGFLS